MNITDTTFAEYLDHLGTDLTVVNAARASFGKESEWEWTDDGGGTNDVRRLKPEDANLIRFLATGYRTKEWDEFLNEIMGYALRYDRDAAKVLLTDLLHAYKRKPQHWAPFGHPHVQIRVSCQSSWPASS